MALCSLRLRRALTLTSSLINRHQRPFSTIPSLSSVTTTTTTPNSQNPNFELTQIHLPFQSRLFRSSSTTLAPPRSPSYNDSHEEIGPDTILFEGCDYNHWLITMDFPKDPKPTPEEMVETYVQTLAKVVGSVEEAKKCMYACSTTTYTGFQAVMTEEMSEKFRGLPGVVFILPDSYIDPVNKEYGGDKYINGTIIPRPPPVQYGRQGGRYGDRNREYNRNSPRGPTPYRGNSGYDNQGSGQGDRGNFGPQQSSPPQNYGPPRTGERRDFVPMNNTPGGRDGYQGERRDPTAPYQANYQGERRDPMAPYQANYRGERRDPTAPYQANYQQGQRDIPPGDRMGYSPPGQRDNRGENMNYSPQGVPYGQGAGGPYGQGAGAAYGQGAGGPSGQGAGAPYGQGAGAPSGQGAGGSYGQGAGGLSGQGAGGPYGREGSSYGQSQPGNGGDQRYSQVEQRNNMQGDQRNYPAMGSTGTDQGRY